MQNFSIPPPLYVNTQSIKPLRIDNSVLVGDQSQSTLVYEQDDKTEFKVVVNNKYEFFDVQTND